jgi:hypothetical protein
VYTAAFIGENKVVTTRQLKEYQPYGKHPCVSLYRKNSFMSFNRKTGGKWRWMEHFLLFAIAVFEQIMNLIL